MPVLLCCYIRKFIFILFVFDYKKVVIEVKSLHSFSKFLDCPKLQRENEKHYFIKTQCE